MTVPCRVCADTAPNAELPTAGGRGTITAAVQMGTGWGSLKALSRWVLG